jgi:hypothetical protein
LDGDHGWLCIQLCVRPGEELLFKLVGCAYDVSAPTFLELDPSGHFQENLLGAVKRLRLDKAIPRYRGTVLIALVAEIPSLYNVECFTKFDDDWWRENRDAALSGSA